MNRPRLQSARTRRNVASVTLALSLAGLAAAVYALAYFLAL